MAKYFIFTNSDSLDEYENEQLEEYLNEYFSSNTFIYTEDGESLLVSDDNAAMVMEYLD